MKIAIHCRDAHGRRAVARLSCHHIEYRAGRLVLEVLDPAAVALVAAGTWRGIRYLGGRSAAVNPRYSAILNDSEALDTG